MVAACGNEGTESEVPMVGGVRSECVLGAEPGNGPGGASVCHYPFTSMSLQERSGPYQGPVTGGRAGIQRAGWWWSSAWSTTADRWPARSAGSRRGGTTRGVVAGAIWIPASTARSWSRRCRGCCGSGTRSGRWACRGQRTARGSRCGFEAQLIDWLQSHRRGDERHRDEPQNGGGQHWVDTIPAPGHHGGVNG